jgi:hypothetical protein
MRERIRSFYFVVGQTYAASALWSYLPTFELQRKEQCCSFCRFNLDYEVPLFALDEVIQECAHDIRCMDRTSERSDSDDDFFLRIAHSEKLFKGRHQLGIESAPDVKEIVHFAVDFDWLENTILFRYSQYTRQFLILLQRSYIVTVRAVSSVGRATLLHREGRGFESPTAH